KQLTDLHHRWMLNGRDYNLLSLRIGARSPYKRQIVAFSGTGSNNELVSVVGTQCSAQSDLFGLYGLRNPAKLRDRRGRICKILGEERSHRFDSALKDSGSRIIVEVDHTATSAGLPC